MITERGKTILGKYMAGQNESTFSYLAIGIGAIPAFDAQVSTASAGQGPGWWKPESDGWKYWYYQTDNSYVYDDGEKVSRGFVPEYNKVDATGTGAIKYSDMKELDYEVLRVPITESGIEFVKQATDSLVDAALTDMILTGTLPSLGEYRFTEIGIYSAQSNAIASSKPSEVLFNFGNVTESWVDNTSTAIPLIPSEATTPTTLGFCKSNNAYFRSSDSMASHRRPRSGQYCLHMPDDTAEVVHNASNFNFTDVRPDDQFRLAFFVDSKPSGTQPDIVDVTFEDANDNTVTATLKTNGEYFVDTNYYIPTTYKGNLYGVAFAKVSDFSGDSAFSWPNVSSVSIKSKMKVFLDSFKYVSTNYNNPNYGLISYSVVQNRSGNAGTTQNPILYPESLYKAENLETLLQYRVRINNSLNGEDYVV